MFTLRVDGVDLGLRAGLSQFFPDEIIISFCFLQIDKTTSFSIRDTGQSQGRMRMRMKKEKYRRNYLKFIHNKYVLYYYHLGIGEAKFIQL